MLTIIPPCAGIIVFNNGKIVLVNTNSGNFSFNLSSLWSFASFTKGKRNRWELDLEVAWRELEEETGLTKDHVELIDNFHIDELSNRGNLCIRHFVGTLSKKLKDFKFNPTELANVNGIMFATHWILKNSKYLFTRY